MKGSFRGSLTARIAGLFALFLFCVTAIGAIAVREFVRHDLEQATRGEVLDAKERMESVLARTRREAAMFAELAANAEGAEEPARLQAASAVRIILARVADVLGRG